VSLVGLGLAVIVPWRVGTAAIWQALSPAWPLLPVCFVCELVRVGLEAVATRWALRRAVPVTPLLLTHLASYAVGAVFPAPRPAAEALKTSLLGPHVGVPEAIASGVVLQAATLLSIATLSLVGAASLFGTPLGVALLANAGVLLLVGVGLRALSRMKALVAWVARRTPRYAPSIARWQAASQEGPLVPWGPSACLLLSLGVRVFEQLLLERRMAGAWSPRAALDAECVRLLGGTVGVFVPGQGGVREGLYAMSAESLGKSASFATAIGIYTHVVELAVAALGFVVLATWRRKARASNSPS
jgi:hypothetical protein